MGSSSEECAAVVTAVISLLQSLGFLINFEKSEIKPVQRIEYIGLIIDSVSMSFFSPPRRQVLFSVSVDPSLRPVNVLFTILPRLSAILIGLHILLGLLKHTSETSSSFLLQPPSPTTTILSRNHPQQGFSFRFTLVDFHR